jgi:ABC-2 type transport system permease protein
MTAIATPYVRTPRAVVLRIPLLRLVQVELRKMFNTRSGFWLLASIVIATVLATVAVIVFAPAGELTYSTFIQAIRLPIAVILPIIAILSVTSEWSQRTGLTTFTLVPHRRRIIAAKAISSVTVGVLAVLLALAIGALGNLVGAAVTGAALVWDASPLESLYFVVGSILSLMIGFMLGVLIRASIGAIVAYFIYQFLLPSILGLLATSQSWFRDLQPWIDLQYAQSSLFLFDGGLTGEQWANIGVTGVIWLFIPLVIGLRFVVRSEVK